MNIAIGCSEFKEASGMPMYIFRIARELVRQHSVFVFANVWGGVMEERATKAHIPCGSYDMFLRSGMKPDVLWLNENTVAYAQQDFIVPTFFLIHSQYTIDHPISNAMLLVAREELNQYYHLRVPVIPIPIPFDEFTPVSVKHEGYRILCPCTIDPIRVPMLNNLYTRAVDDTVVKIRGENHLGDVSWLKNTDHVTVELRPWNNTQELFTWADEVAGIFEGTVTLEAWAMGKKTSVYDTKGNFVMKSPPPDFREKHDAKNVAQKLLDMFYASTH